MINEEIGCMIKHLRKKSGLTQRELGEEVGLTQSTIYHVEHGDCNFKMDTIVVILDYFGYELTTTKKRRGAE